jgi:two-component system CheB/CheR fusion protein
VERTILEQAAPGALVDENFIVRFLHGDTSRYLSMPKGEPSFNILDMARGELGENIREGVGQVKSTGRGVVMEDVRVFKSFDVLIVDLELSPLRGAAKGMGDSLHFLILFREREMESEGGGDSSRVATLEQELQSTRQDLQATIEELETSNEELKSSNEEQQANLEELQSTNEELETSREELQSTNEELEGVNAELQRKNEELRKAKDDIANIFAATEIGTVFLDTDLNVKRFNPAARNIFKLRDEDRGRPLTDIASRIDYEEITDDVSQVLDNLTKKHRDLQAREGEWYRVIIRPYRTSDNVIQGVVLTFADISGLRLARMLAERRADMIQGLLETFTRPVLILDQDTRVDSVNDAFLETMDASREGIEGTMISDLPRPPWDRDRLKELLEDLGENDGVRRAVLPASDGNGKWSVRAWALDKEPKTGPWAVLILYPDQEDAAFDPSENKTP